MSGSSTDQPMGCQVSVAPISDGCCIRVTGRGTANESRAVRDAARRTLQANPPARVVLDLNDCTYLDSTFLGCLLELNRAGGKSKLFSVAASSEHRSKLLGAMRLDRLIPCVDAAPDPRGSWVPLEIGRLADVETTRHVMECHRRLAEIDSPMQVVFARIAEQMQRELSGAAGPR